MNAGFGRGDMDEDEGRLFYLIDRDIMSLLRLYSVFFYYVQAT